MIWLDNSSLKPSMVRPSPKSCDEVLSSFHKIPPANARRDKRDARRRSAKAVANCYYLSRRRSAIFSVMASLMIMVATIRVIMMTVYLVLSFYRCFSMRMLMAVRR